MTARLVDVAKAAGVPVNTVSNVVHESPHVHPDTRARVEHLIKIGCHRIAALGGGPTRNRRPHTVAPRHGGRALEAPRRA
ncbi:LacI family DNA-binding transcriptional regulator [Cutibacterium acnes]